MIFDELTLLSDRQAITATARSTNVIDLGASTIKRDVGKGVRRIPIRIQVVEPFNNLTSLTVALQVSNDPTFATGVKTVWSHTAVAADLVAGYVVVPEHVTRGTDLRYMSLNYTVAGTAPTTGRVTAGITMGNQSNG